MNKKHIRGSHTNQHVRKEDPKLKTADQFIVGVSPMARTSVFLFDYEVIFKGRIRFKD